MYKIVNFIISLKIDRNSPPFPGLPGFPLPPDPLIACPSPWSKAPLAARICPFVARMPPFSPRIPPLIPRTILITGDRMAFLAPKMPPTIAWKVTFQNYNS